MIVEKRKLADDLLAGDAEVNLTELSDEALTGNKRVRYDTAGGREIGRP